MDPIAHVPQPAEPLVLLLDFEPELVWLFTEWLTGAGLRVTSAGVNEAMAPDLGSQVCAVVAHLPLPRLGGVERLLPRADVVRGKPIVALSPAFRGDVPPHGVVARDLGVAAVVPASVTREALVSAVNAALRRVA